ncbi:alkene reductase [Stenotrophomonas tuberculopleuritidis]|uniref:alkene reductase n=1 Tax=Stenotrophomonas tuberculopleuritidis TaxID=3055079 RepID=UPI0026E53F33|nr:alkene reductase [Stenotrophomonas sp. 704A1]
MSQLFEPFDLRGLSLKNRIAMAPLTRSRSPDEEPLEITAQYYAQRAGAGLIVSEGAPISEMGRGNLFTPGLFRQSQVDAWRKVTNAVHAAGGTIFAQLWHVGRVSHSSLYPENAAPVSASARRANGAKAYAWTEESTPGFVQSSMPRALQTEEVSVVAQEYAQAAAHAITAGFDGVEIHGANGYLIDQFLNPLVNDREDSYTGSTIEGRTRFALEVVDAVCERIGRERTAIRLSPYGQAFDMPLFEDIDETFKALAVELSKRGIAYVHLMDHPRANLGLAPIEASPSAFDDLRAQMRQLMPGTPLMLAGNMTAERANALLEEGEIDMAAFGRLFIPNPDLVERLRNRWPLAIPDPSTFYGGGAAGYIDFPTYSECTPQR